jgi:hypothetical protein
LRFRQHTAAAPDDPEAALAALHAGGYPKLHVIDKHASKSKEKWYDCSTCDKTLTAHSQATKVNCWGPGVDAGWAARLQKDVRTIARYKADAGRARALGLHVWPPTCSAKYLSCTLCRKTISSGNRYTHVSDAKLVLAPVQLDRDLPST